MNQLFSFFCFPDHEYDTQKIPKESVNNTNVRSFLNVGGTKGVFLLDLSFKSQCLSVKGELLRNIYFLCDVCEK